MMSGEQKEILPPATDRRFDSFAWLMQQDGSDCGAACFDGQHLILTNNHEYHAHPQLIELIKNYVSTLAEEGYQLDQKFSLAEKDGELDVEGRKSEYEAAKKNI